MGSFLSFVIGAIAGVIGAWWFFERRDAQSRETMEAGWKKKLDHVEAEVRRADAAHDETKERLRQLQQERLPTPTEAASIDKTKPASALASATVSTTPDAPTVGEAERTAQARRRIDAKLAQLPAGSSARKRLMAERAVLGAGAERPSTGAEQ